MHIALTVSEPEIWHPFYPFSGNLFWVLLFVMLIAFMSLADSEFNWLKFVGATASGIAAMSVAALLGNNFWGIALWFWIGLIATGALIVIVPGIIEDVMMWRERKHPPVEHG